MNTKHFMKRHIKREYDEDRIEFYDSELISDMVDNDELSCEESGFMQGYMDAGFQ